MNSTFDYNRQYLTICNRAEMPDNHRSRVILHNTWEWYFGEYSDIEQLREFARAVGGFDWKLHHVDHMDHIRVYGSRWEKCEPYEVEFYELSHKFNLEPRCHKSAFCGLCSGFWSLDEIPANAYEIMGYSNGSLVKCYATNDGETISIYRPNPNAKEVYNPLSLDNHLAYIRKHGDLGPVDNSLFD